ncbi:hypothetical protein F4777DRAFT_568746 [Nemania sp. FL0916]|nr:hypothetical protein F4777DRAFT_568746 [Nemania sp. FL0916]
MSLDSQSQQHPRYTRIRVHKEADFKKLYPLILDYIREPELALSVKEFVFRCHLPSRVGYLGKRDRADAWKAEEDVRDVSGEHVISQCLTDLGLEGSEKTDWVRVLTWMKPEIVASRNEASAREARSYDVEPYIRHRTRLFAHYAAALLLMLCPNIELIRYEDGSKIIEDILRRNNYGLLPAVHLQKLREVTLHPTTDEIQGDDRFYIHLDILALLRLFHRLPAIESMSTDGVGPNGRELLDHFPPAISNLKKIRVGHSINGTDVIGPLIRVSKHLEEFTFTTGGRCNLEGGHCRRCPETIGKALYQHRSSLRKVDIDIDEFISRNEADEEDEDWASKDEWYRRDKEISSGPLTTARMRSTRHYGATIGSMHDFESLTHLSIGIGTLLGQYPDEEAPFRLIDALPRSLEYLLIRGYERGAIARYDSQIDEFLLAKQDRLPLLKELHGIEKTVPIAESVDNPDEEEDEEDEEDEDDDDDDDDYKRRIVRLWRPENTDDSWTQEPITTGHKRKASQLSS